MATGVSQPMRWRVYHRQHLNALAGLSHCDSCYCSAASIPTSWAFSLTMYAVIPAVPAGYYAQQRPLALAHLVNQRNLRLVVPFFHQASAQLSTFPADPCFDRFDPHAVPGLGAFDACYSPSSPNYDLELQCPSDPDRRLLRLTLVKHHSTERRRSHQRIETTLYTYLLAWKRYRVISKGLLSPSGALLDRQNG